MEDILNNSNKKYVSAFKAGGKSNLGILKGSIKNINEDENAKNLRLTIDIEQKKVKNIR